SLSYQPQKIEDRLGDGSHYDVRIGYTFEASPLGTAGAYRNAEERIRETTVVLNGDILTDIDLNDVIRFHRQRQSVATIVMAPVSNPAEYGLVKIDAEARVCRFQEKPNPEDVTCDTINAGIYILEPAVLDYVPEAEPSTFEYGVFPRLVERQVPVYGYIWRGYWRDIGTPASYLQANLDVLSGKIQLFPRSPGARGEKFDDAAEIDDLSMVDPSCTVKAGARIVNSVISRNCYIEERARIEDSVIRSGTRIGTGAVIRNSCVGKGCHIGRAAATDGAVL